MTVELEQQRVLFLLELVELEPTVRTHLVLEHLFEDAVGDRRTQPVLKLVDFILVDQRDLELGVLPAQGAAESDGVLVDADDSHRLDTLEFLAQLLVVLDVAQEE